jgi:hypothetical protein
VDFLDAQGFDVAGPEGPSYTPEGSKEVQTVLWQTVSFKTPVVPADAIFFIQYAPRPADAPKRKLPDHPNTALGIHAVWMAVHDLDAAVKAYELVGLRAGRKLKVPTLGAKGREVEAGRGMILLLQASDSGGVVASYLAGGGEGIMGVSIQVRDLEAARAFLETNTKQQLAIYKGPYGKSISVSPKLTHGVQIELFHE